MYSVCIEEHLTDCGIVEIGVLQEPLLGEPLLCHGLLIEFDVRPCENVVLGLITRVGELLASRPISLTKKHQGSYYLTSRKLKGSRNCLRFMRNERRKMNLMKRSKKSEETLTSSMDQMRQTFEPCDVCNE